METKFHHANLNEQNAGHAVLPNEYSGPLMPVKRRPKASQARRIAYASIFTALTVVGAKLSFYIPFGAVYLTFQTLFVIAAGLVLGARGGAFSQAVYLIMGLIGLPVFSAGGGLSYVFQPSFGYLLAFPLGAALSGFLIKKVKKINVINTFWCCLVGLALINIIGASYQLMILIFYLGRSAAVLPVQLLSVSVYFLKDAALLALLSVTFPRLKKQLRALEN